MRRTACCTSAPSSCNCSLSKRARANSWASSMSTSAQRRLGRRLCAIRSASSPSCSCCRRSRSPPGRSNGCRRAARPSYSAACQPEGACCPVRARSRAPSRPRALDASGGARHDARARGGGSRHLRRQGLAPPRTRRRPLCRQGTLRVLRAGGAADGQRR